jgi:hypothetical protein
MRHFDDLISLGPSCGVKYQIALNGFRRDQPDIMRGHFRAVHATHKHLYRRGSSTHFFDWLVSPFPSVVRLIDRDFAGAFQRRNLEVTGDRNIVLDRSSGLFYYHAFERHGDKLSEREVDLQYPKQRAKHRHCREKLRALLRSDARVLYVVGLSPQQSLVDVQPWHEVLKRHHPRHRYVLLCVRSSWSREVVRQSIVVRHEGRRELLCDITAVNEKPALDSWQFNDGPWQQLLDRFDWRAPAQ